MKSVCSSTSSFKTAIIQTDRRGVLRNYKPTRASWKRFVRMVLHDRSVKMYTSFRVWSCSGFKAQS